MGEFLIPELLPRPPDKNESVSHVVISIPSVVAYIVQCDIWILGIICVV